MPQRLITHQKLTGVATTQSETRAGETGQGGGGGSMPPTFFLSNAFFLCVHVEYFKKSVVCHQESVNFKAVFSQSI